MSDILPLLSVLMTSYNREKYIEESIQSVLNQTFTDFELIIVDDASSTIINSKSVKVWFNTL